MHAGSRSQGSPQFGCLVTAEPESRRQESYSLDERLQDRSSSYIIAYLLPFFTSLSLAFPKKQSVRFHAIQSALGDAFTIIIFFIESIPVGIYSTIQYGSSPIPEDDPVMNIFVAPVLVIPLALRAFCIVQLMRHRHPQLWLLGRIAKRLAYRKSTTH